MTLTLYLALMVFLIGLFFYTKTGSEEGFGTTTDGKKKHMRCPNMLIQKGPKFYLYNSKLAQVPGVNPIEFDNLEDYSEFLEWQKSQGIRCPVLYLQKTYDVQGNSVYKVKPSVSDPQNGLPPAPLTISGVAALATPMSVQSGTSYSPQDAKPAVVPNPALSPDAMDPNWGGDAYTQSLIDAGYYKGDEVSIYIS